MTQICSADIPVCGIAGFQPAETRKLGTLCSTDYLADLQVGDTAGLETCATVMETTPVNLGRYIDYALFAPDATRAAIEKACAEARAKNYHSVCVNGSRVELARTVLEDANIQVVALVGFPLGASDTDTKRYETEVAVDAGAQEIEFVIDIGRLKDGDRQFVLREMRDIAEAADERLVKAVLQTHLLTPDEKILACQLALDSGIHFVATSTDFHAPAVELEEIRVLRETLGEQLGIKAAGQIRDAQAAQAFIDAGANRVGISAIFQSK